MTIRIDGTNTAANPGITGTDTDTGLQFGTDEVNIVTGGSTRATVDSDGDFGIGTTSPSALLHIAKSGGNAKLLVQRSNTAANTDDYGSIVWQSSAGNNNALIGAARHSAENDAYMFFSTASGGTLQEVGRFTHDGDLRFNSGYGSVATAYGCRAWASWRGDITSGGNSQLNGSGNVSSVTDNGSGDYTINFSNAMPDDQYVVVGNCIEDATNNRGDHLFTMHRSGRATGSVRVNTINLAGTPIDDDFVFAAVIR